MRLLNFLSYTYCWRMCRAWKFSSVASQSFIMGICEDLPWARITTEADDCWPFLLKFYKFCISFRSQLIVLGIKKNTKEILAVKYSIYTWKSVIQSFPFLAAFCIYQAYIFCYCWRGFLEASEKLLDLAIKITWEIKIQGELRAEEFLSKAHFAHR